MMEFVNVHLSGNALFGISPRRKTVPGGGFSLSKPFYRIFVLPDQAPPSRRPDMRAGVRASPGNLTAFVTRQSGQNIRHLADVVNGASQLEHGLSLALKCGSALSAVPSAGGW